MSLEGADTATVTDWATKLVGRAARRAARCATSPATPARRAWPPTSTSTATPPRASAITASAVDDALYSAFGQRIVSTIFTETNQYRVILEAQPGLLGDAPSRSASCNLRTGVGRRRRRCRRIATITRAAARRCRSRTSPSTRPRRSASTPRPASRSARRSTRSARRPRTIGLPASVTHDLPRRVGRLRELADQPAVADPGGGGLRLHRARRAVRELHPPADDPVDPAVGRRRRAAGADDHAATTWA